MQSVVMASVLSATISVLTTLAVIGGIFPSIGRAEADQQGGRVVRADRFELTDPRGNVRLVVSADNGDPVMGLLDRSGNPRVALALASDGSGGIALLDRAGQNRASLGIESNDVAKLLIKSPQGTAAGLGAGPDPMSALVFMDQQGALRVALGLTADGSEALAFTDLSGIM
jgi:hypothetical protein